MQIRTATIADLPAICRIESACFPAAEAATEADLSSRLKHYPDHFWLLSVEEELVAFLNGMATDEPDLRDEMYSNAALHNEHGAWQMIFGVDTLPSHRRQGYAGKLLQHVIAKTRVQGRKGLVLTCKDALVPYYAKFGFVDEGLSPSTHGNVAWHQMRLAFQGAETP